MLKFLNGKKTVIGAVLLVASTVAKWWTGEETVSVDGILGILEVIAVAVTGAGLVHKGAKGAKDFAGL